jgi:hypothetical protein
VTGPTLDGGEPRQPPPTTAHPRDLCREVSQAIAEQRLCETAELGHHHLAYFAVGHRPIAVVQDLHDLHVVVEVEDPRSSGHSQATLPSSAVTYTSSGATPNASPAASRPRSLSGMAALKTTFGRISRMPCSRSASAMSSRLIA